MAVIHVYDIMMVTALDGALIDIYSGTGKMSNYTNAFFALLDKYANKMDYHIKRLKPEYLDLLDDRFKPPDAVKKINEQIKEIIIKQIDK